LIKLIEQSIKKDPKKMPLAKGVNG
jgi:hypothetical protein